jgi:hypothetical protein
MGRISRPETSVRYYHFSLRNDPEELSSYLLSRRKPKITHQRCLLSWWWRQQVSQNFRCTDTKQHGITPQKKEDLASAWKWRHFVQVYKYILLLMCQTSIIYCTAVGEMLGENRSIQLRYVTYKNATALCYVRSIQPVAVFPKLRKAELPSFIKGKYGARSAYCREIYAAWPLNMGPRGCPETSVINDNSMLRKPPEQWCTYHTAAETWTHTRKMRISRSLRY